MATTVKMVQNDTAPDLTINVKRNGSVVNLSGSTVRFKISNSATNTRTNDLHNTCTLTDAVNGVVTYVFQAGDIPTAGGYLCDVEITYGSGKVESGFAPVQLEVRAEA